MRKSKSCPLQLSRRLFAHIAITQKIRSLFIQRGMGSYHYSKERQPEGLSWPFAFVSIPNLKTC
jgi:hypothetical protein